jgi:uncharacterized membrane protein
MNIGMIILRIIHIFGGIFWIGVLWYNVIFFLPRIKKLGQERGRVMQTLTAPPFQQYMTGAGLAPVLSGILMFWRTSGGFSRAWLGTSNGIVLLIAALLGLYVVVEGLIVQRPAGLRMAALGRQAASAGGPPNPAIMREMEELSSRMERAATRYAYLTALAVFGMATFRYW